MYPQCYYTIEQKRHMELQVSKEGVLREVLTSCLAAGPWAGTCGCFTDRPCNKSSTYHAVIAALGPGWWQHPRLFLVDCADILDAGDTYGPTGSGPEVHK